MEDGVVIRVSHKTASVPWAPSIPRFSVPRPCH